jgi:exonuclease 3'-5' domain-containing protein 1
MEGSRPYYTLCTTGAHVQAALATLSQSEYLVLDCEGQELGKQGGALSLLAIGTAHGQDVFLFDVVKLRRKTPAIRALITLLGRADVHKVVWDGRMDAVAIRETYGATIAGVVDLQLAEIVSRFTVRGEDERRRLGRLFFAIGRSVYSMASRYTDVHALLGLDKCLRTCEVGLEHVKSGTPWSVIARR